MGSRKTEDVRNEEGNEELDHLAQLFEDRSRLLQHLVLQNFGPAVGEVAGLLLSRGSLPFSHLIRLSSLPPKIIFHSLLVLSIHSLLYHSESDVAGRLIELYEINPDAVENRLRGSLYADLAADVGLGGGLDTAVLALLRQGMLTAPQIAAEVVRARQSGAAMFVDAPTNGSSAKGKGKEKEGSIDRAAERAALTMISRAVRDGYLSIITPGSQLSPSSLEIKWEEELRLSITKNIPKAKELREIKDKLREKKAQWAEEERERAQGKPPGGDGIKRKKRMGADDAEYLIPLPKGAFYRINAERFHVRWRNQLILEYAQELYNTAVASILSIILDLVENDVESITDATSRAFTSNEILTKLQTIDPPPVLSNCFAPKAPDPSWNIPKRTHDFVIEICRFLECADNDGADSSRAFLHSASAREGTTGKWYVHYERLGAGMKRALVESLIKEKMGDRALLLWRILDAKGKLDEKHLARLAFIPAKEAREILLNLTSSALVEQQEVPRSADRAPARTVFLWYVDYDKVVSSLVDHHTKALANIQAQKSFQLSKRQGLIDKRERSDVRAEPEKFLTARDFEAIEELDSLLEALTVAEMRIDKDMFVLRELDPVM